MLFRSGPVIDQCGNVVGVVVAVLPAHERGAAQNVGFAINIDVLIAFLNSHGVPYSTQTSERSLQTVELAEKAQSITVLILCEK